MVTQNLGRLRISVLVLVATLVAAAGMNALWQSGAALYSLFLVFGAMCVSYTYYKVNDGGLLQPMFFVICCLLLGTVLKIIYICSVSNIYVDYTLLLGNNFDVLNGGILIISLSMIALSMGYLAGGVVAKSKARERTPAHGIRITLLGNATTLVCVFLIIVSAASFAGYLYLYGFNPDQLSGKRFSGGGGVDPSARFYDIGYYLFKLVLVAKASFYIFFIRALLGDRGLRNSLLLILSFMLVITVSFYFSNRIVTVSIVADSLVLSGLFLRRINWKYVFIILGFVFFVFMVASSQRSEAAASKSMLDHIFAGRYLLDVAKNAHFYNYFVNYENLLIEQFRSFNISEFLYTYVNLGRVAGATVFGLRAAGVPLGFVIELYALAGFIGVVLGMFVLGLVLRGIAKKLAKRDNYDYKLIFAGLLSVRLTVFLFNGGVGSTTYQIILDAVPLILIVMAANTFDRKSRRYISVAQR